MRTARISMIVGAAVLWAGSAFGGTVTQKTFQSQALGKTVTYYLYRPANYDQEVAAGKKFSVIYMMHWWLYIANGWNSTDGNRRNPTLDKVIDSVQDIICVAPQDETPLGTSGVGTSWWIDGSLGKYSSLMYQDMVAEAEATNACYADRSHRGLCGPSMGGFGTLHNLRAHSDVFSVGYAIVPLCDLKKNMANCGYGTCTAFGQTYNSALDPLANAADFKSRNVKLAFYTGHCPGTCANNPPASWGGACPALDCKAPPDFFQPEAVAFDAALTAAGVPHTFNDYVDDGHEYPSPSKMVMILKYFQQNFGSTSAYEPLPYSRRAAKAPATQVKLIDRASRNVDSRVTGFVGIDGKSLRQAPKAGIVVEVKR